MVKFKYLCAHFTPPCGLQMCPDSLQVTSLASIKYLIPEYADSLDKDIRSNFTLLERAVAQFDTRFTLRALRSISSLRKRLTDRILCSVIVLTYQPNNPTARILIEAIGMDGEAIADVASQYAAEFSNSKQSLKEIIPEIDVYIAILIQVGTLLQHTYCQDASVLDN